MNHTLLSIIVPGIRPQLWNRIYLSIIEALNDIASFELIFIGPYDLPKNLVDNRVKYIEDFGSPSRAMNIGLVNSEGEYITWAADDGWFLKDTLYDLLQHPPQHREVITAKYIEGDGENMDKEYYYTFGHAIDCSNLCGVNKDAYILNIGLVKKTYLEYIGGWNACDYETPFGSHLDLAARLHIDKAKFSLYPEPIFQCEHMPTITGDHAPIHYAHYRDMINFRQKYTNIQGQTSQYIALNNWKDSPTIWHRRFSKGIPKTYEELAIQENYSI